MQDFVHQNGNAVTGPELPATPMPDMTETEYPSATVERTEAVEAGSGIVQNAVARRSFYEKREGSDALPFSWNQTTSRSQQLRAPRLSSKQTLEQPPSEPRRRRSEVFVATFGVSRHLIGMPTKSPTRGPSEPLFNIPRATAGLVAVLLAVHALRGFLSNAADLQLVVDWGFVPARLALLIDPDATREALAALIEAVRPGVAGVTPEQSTHGALAAYILRGDGARLQTAVTYSALHGGWDHAGINSLWLVVFGSIVDRRFGALRFLVFCLVTTLAGAAAHALADPMSVTPMIGASAIVSGCTGAAARFAFSGGGPLSQTFSGEPDLARRAARQPALPLLKVLSDSRVLGFVGVWAVLNIVVGLSAQPLGLADGGIAWIAHMGGFFAGFLGFALFDPVARPPESVPVD